MVRKLEKQYGIAVRRVMATVNPIKKLIIKTHCAVHKYISIMALEIIKDKGYEKEYIFFRKYIDQLNNGNMWADQDFKSTNHFYHFSKEKGLFGFSNALDECKKYYNMSINFAKEGDMDIAMFYLGAACHLIQDSTVPQHVNNRLLNKHRNFEVWIKTRLVRGSFFPIADEIKRYETVDRYIKANALMASRTYTKYSNILDDEKRYGSIANVIIAEAQKTTAGFMLDFYCEIFANINCGEG